MSIQKAEMSIEQIENGQIVEHVAYPYVEYEHVAMENGMDIMSMIRDDVSTPMVTHNATSWKVGQGDSDVSESIVDSSVGGMTIKGQTYQNILPSPSLRNSMTNGKTMQKLNEGYDSVNTVDGVSKSAILSGQTLVNLATPIEFKSITYHGYCLIINGGMLKSGTYTLKSSVDFSQYVVNLMSTQKDKPSQYRRISIAKNGVFTIDDTFFVANGVTTEDFFICLRPVDNPSGGTVTTNEIENAEFILLEGDYTNVDIPYFTGMSSVKLPVLTTTGKNLFDRNKLEEGDFNSVGIPTQNQSRCRTSYFIQVESGSKITLSKSTAEWFKVFGYDNNKNFICIVLDSKSSHATFTIPSNVCFIKIKFDYSIDIAIDDNIQLECDTQVTSYEPYKTNILTVNEDVTLCGIGDVTDELDCLTGKVTERIGEIMLDGSEGVWSKHSGLSTDEYDVYWTSNGFIPSVGKKMLSDKLGYSNPTTPNTFRINDSGGLFIGVSKGVNIRDYLSQNTPKIQYDLTEPTIKTVDLSSSGNWEKVVLDGSEDWGADGSYCFCRNLQINSACAFTDSIPVLPTKTNSLPSHASFSGARYFTVLIDGILNDPVKLKQYLSQNPMTVWYQTETHQDSTQVKQPIFFKDGHIQLSSGADNSLIPTLDYEAKTSNSYVMDLMKTNTRYTMKAKSASGTFTIDGTSYGAGTNGTFITPTSMTNKLLVMSDTAHEEVMIIEGDVTSKAIPYFKGIKSAFEDESKIEVLSTGKNLYSHGDSAFTPERDGWYFINGDRETLFGDKVHKDCGQGAWFYLEGGRYYFNVVGNDNVKTLQVVGEKERLYGSGATIPKGWYALRMRVQNANQEVSITNVMVEKDTETNYEPYKSNSTKIPLLSPLRSLPNGVRDEIILDRVNHKAKIVQRVGEDLTQLETPVITEVNLEGYPYVYKGGHIFLNTEIAPITEVTYSINQAHQIESSNEDILRHQNEINHLYELIAQYVQVQYEAELIDIALQG